MSGIAGIVRFDGAALEAPAQITRMTGAMAHRGPDGISAWQDKNVALGQCQLRTTPESLEEILPLSNEDQSLVLVMDGRVDNWQALRTELIREGAVLRSRADAELVLRAYEQWGGECLERIDGDFAFAVWDGRRQALFCARDRAGNRPFHYAWDGQTLLFASELHAILAVANFAEVLNEGWLAEYLAAAWVSLDETMWKGVMRLPPAHYMVIDRDGARTERYWKPDLWANLSCRTDEEYIAHYRDLLADVVRRMSRSHRPLGCEVSGGLDSSALFAVSADLLRGGRLLAPSLHGFTLDFHDDRDANELSYVRAVSEHVGIPVDEVAPTILPLSFYQQWAARYREFPGYPNGVMAQGLRIAAVDGGTRAMLSGVGGDEWLGTPWTGAYYAEQLAARDWASLVASAREDVRMVGVGETAWRLLRHGAAPLFPQPVKRIARNLRGAKDGDRFLAPNLWRALEERRTRYARAQPLTVRRYGQRRLLELLDDSYGVLARESEERLSASMQLELRRPLWSREIIEFAFATPAWLRSRGDTTKWLHRQAMRGLLPAIVVERTTKASFAASFARTLEGIGADTLREIISRRSAWLGLDAGATVLEGAGHGGLDPWQLWSLIGCDALATP